ncbi:MAG: Asp-tRNA(Asn)/Glu-tRNA(Gln) amidotransferase subunit GatA [Bacilli bacterium]|nr:Asp-tRNA(Asn)/Glu-tRNA(Gln) amidotransferase subunit GatA [Bacilli bacterium]
MSKLLELSIKELNNKLKSKEIKPLDLVLEAFEKIESNKELNLFITLDKENAIKKAKELENKEVDNILFGIPIALKDNIVTKDLKTTAASQMLNNFIPIYDAGVVEKIKAKNMIIIGKLNMDEFGVGSTNETSYYGPVLNPWNNKLVPGGSSGGAAAAVSARVVPLALGSDTGGSIRQPSAMTGIVGMSPTYGRVSRYGLIALASSLDQIGPMTNDIYSNALLLNVIAGHDSKDLTSSNKEVEDYTRLIGEPIKGLKIAVPNYFVDEIVDEDIKNKIAEVIKLLIEKGATVNYIDIKYIDLALSIYQIISAAEASSNLARYDGIRYGYRTASYSSLEELYKKTKGEGFKDNVKLKIMLGLYVLSGKNKELYYEKATKFRNALTDNLELVFSKYDLIIGPTTKRVAYPLNTFASDDSLTVLSSLAGLPSLSLPIGFDKGSLPIGMQIIGGKFKEALIYKLAYEIEQTLNLNLNPNRNEE